MTEKAISPLRRRLIEDMTIRRLSPKTQSQYIRHVKKFADFLGRSADKATAGDVHRYNPVAFSHCCACPTPISRRQRRRSADGNRQRRLSPQKDKSFSATAPPHQSKSPSRRSFTRRSRSKTTRRLSASH
jgi:Phage integrase, N-terminal SAM-like domain